MNKIFFILNALLFFGLQTSFGGIIDSLRIEKKDGANFVIHRVDKGQTLFGTLRRYGTSLAEYKAANPDAEMNIKIGQILKVPYNKPIKNIITNKTKPNEVVKDKEIVKDKVTKTQNDVAAIEIVKTAPKTFKVEPGMTLFAVATRNKTTVANIKRMNNLKSDVIRPGQILIVKEAEEITKKVPVKPEPKLSTEKVVVKEEAPVVVAKKPIEKEVIVIEKEKTEVPTKATSVIVEKPKVGEAKPADMPKPDTAFPKPAVISEPIKTAEQIDEEKERVVKVEEGIAEIIEVESKSGKYLALHKTAPLGTLVQVKNETTGASVWVKVIGRLPGVDQNENVIIKLSPKAMDRVSPIDKRFRAKISYSL